MSWNRGVPNKPKPIPRPRASEEIREQYLKRKEAEKLVNQKIKESGLAEYCYLKVHEDIVIIDGRFEYNDIIQLANFLREYIDIVKNI